MNGTELESFRDHCRLMSNAEHLPECGYQRIDNWGWQRWVRPAPDCKGCIPDADRELWLRLADEIDDHLMEDDDMPDLFSEPVTTDKSGPDLVRDELRKAATK